MGSRSTLEDQEQPGDLDRAPMTDFQWEQKWRCCYPISGDRLYRHFTYHETTFPSHEGYLNLVANAKDRQNLANNATGTKDAIDEMFFEERVTTVNVEILTTTVTYDEEKRKREELTVREMNMQQPDYATQNVVAMIMQRMNVAFLPDVESFANAGQQLNGFVINDRVSLIFALNLLDLKIQQVPQDYIDQPDFGDHKPCLYLVTKNVGFRQRNVDRIDNKLNDGDLDGLAPTMPRHPVASRHQKPPEGSPLPHIKPGAICYWKDAIRQDLRLAPFADHEDEAAVLLGVKTTTGVELIFDLQVIGDKLSSFTKYLAGHEHVYHKLLG